MALNAIQQEVLDTIIKTNFDLCEDLTLENKLIVLKAMVSARIDDLTLATLTQLDMVDGVNEIRNILSHPNPQDNHPHGLLGLNKKNDGDTAPVTKKDVVNYIKHKLYMMIHESRAGLQRTSWDISEDTCEFMGKPHNLVNLEYNARSISIKTDQSFSRKPDPMYSPFSPLIYIWARVSNTEDAKEISERLIAVNPMLHRKRVKRDDGFGDFPIEMRGYEEYSCMNFNFLGKDPSIKEFLAAINEFVFENKLPFVLYNELLNATGQEMQDYEEGVAYEEYADPVFLGDGVGSTAKRVDALQQVFSPLFSTMVARAPQAPNEARPATAGELHALLCAFDQSSAYEPRYPHP